MGGWGLSHEEVRQAELRRDAEWAASVGDPEQRRRVDYRDQLERALADSNGAEAGGNETARPFALAVETSRALGELPEPPETDMLVGPLVVRGDRTIVVGDTGHGKTTFAFLLAAAVLTGSDMLGYHGCGAGPVLIIDLEQGLRSIKRVLRETGLADRDDLLIARAPDGLNLDSDDDQRAELAAVVERHRPALVILDPYYKAHRGDANDERPIVDLMRYLDALRTE